MCGIAGVVEASGRVDRSVVEVMARSMTARGPDGAGYYYAVDDRLGMTMRRLSIIDLNGGWQPLYNEDHSVAVMQNGEIYNYRELRRQLEAHHHDFATQSDTEVLAHGYEQWGIEGLLERLDGMYALAVYDAERRQLHLARDRFGEKPLYYHAAPGRFVYASQFLTVASYPGVNDRWDLEGLNLYLALHFVPGDVTVWQGIRKLRAGHYATVDVLTGRLRIQRYWSLTEREQTREPDELLEALDHAVRSRLVADVPVGIFLSGGLDSSVMAALAVRHVPRIATFSMGFGSLAHDESAHAAQVARALGTDHHEFRFDGNSFLELLPEVVAGMDEPVGDQAMLPVFWLCREAVQRVRVVLSGEGADEVFGGYGYYRNAAPRSGVTKWWRRFLGRRTPSADPDAVLLSSNCTLSGFPLLTGQEERNRLLGLSVAPAYSTWHGELLENWRRTCEPLRRVCHADIDTWLPDDLLMKFDKMAMANSLEGRAPYLCPRLASMAWQLPYRDKFRHGENKYSLRAVAENLLPESIRQRPKQGFVLPMGQWLADYFRTNTSPHEFAGSAMQAGLEPAALEGVIAEDLKRGIQRERLLYALVVLERWALHARAHVRNLRREMAERTPAVAA